MTEPAIVTFAEYVHADCLGQEDITISACQHPRWAPRVEFSVPFYMYEGDEPVLLETWWTAGQARDLAASLLLAADHVDGRVAQ